ncbi:MAG: leucine-rich repeat domain-containing protein [Oscillospiraceae bacterium]|nr:leucine-rich repeat domain-containing protein [Oscillospiraceae bacterium]
MKIGASLLAAAMLLAFAPVTAHAETEAVTEETQDTTEKSSKKTTEDGWFSYGFDEEGNVEIYDFNMHGYLGEVVVPSEIEGKPVVYLGNACFLEAFNLTSVVIPASVESMGESVFFGCSSLEKITVEEGNPYYTSTEDGILMGDDEKFLVCYPAGKPEESYTIPDTVDEIAAGCFAYAKNLKTVEIPDSVLYVDNWSFAYSKIESIALPDSVIEVDDYAFAYCENLSDVDLGNGIQSIANAGFAFCPSLKEITIPESLSYVGQYAFAATGMKSVTIPVTLANIDYCAFGYNEDLHAINDFVIYGVAGSAAQIYAEAVDEDNSYMNDFPFLEIEAEGASEAADPADSAAEQKETDSAEDPAAPAAKENNPLPIILGVCGGIIAVLAAVLIVLLVKKPAAKKEGGAEQKNEDEA